MKDIFPGGEYHHIILEWFEQNHRVLPWRSTYAPYQVWISEIMLQQTQMDRVVDYFNRWVEKFPDVNSLATASEVSVLKAWEGLGYYTRARNIMKAAVEMVEKYDGLVPDRYTDLLSLPGIGPYTAAAIMSIAYDQPYPVIDANVERLFARIVDIAKSMKEKSVRAYLEESLKNMLQGVSPRNFNQALMELGALVCTPSNPDCNNCPLRDCCKAREACTVAQRPVKKRKQERIDIIMACVIIEQDGKLFIQQRRNDDVWGGLWEFPGGRLKNGESAEEAARRELYEETEIEIDTLIPFAIVTHYYTRYRVTLHSFVGKGDGFAKPVLHAAQQHRWVTLGGLSGYAFPSGHRQLIARMHTHQEKIAKGI